MEKPSKRKEKNKYRNFWKKKKIKLSNNNQNELSIKFISLVQFLIVIQLSKMNLFSVNPITLGLLYWH